MATKRGRSSVLRNKSVVRRTSDPATVRPARRTTDTQPGPGSNHQLLSLHLSNHTQRKTSMKSIHTAVVSVLLSFTPVLWAQTADDYIAQGESYLAATNLIGANNSFSNAVILSPNNPTGNVL